MAKNFNILFKFPFSFVSTSFKYLIALLKYLKDVFNNIASQVSSLYWFPYRLYIFLKYSWHWVSQIYRIISSSSLEFILLYISYKFLYLVTFPLFKFIKLLTCCSINSGLFSFLSHISGRKWHKVSYKNIFEWGINKGSFKIFLINFIFIFSSLTISYCLKKI